MGTGEKKKHLLQSLFTANLINMAEIATVILLFRAKHHPLKMVLPVCLSPKMGETFKGQDLHTVHSPKWSFKPLGCVWISVGEILFRFIFRGYFPVT
jgi:hypothetical protein